MNTVPETEYQRSGDARFGTTYDVGDTLQEMTCEKAPAFSFTIDALDGTDQAIEKSAARALRRQLDEVTVPGMDKHRIKKWVMGANIVKKETTGSHQEHHRRSHHRRGRRDDRRSGSPGGPYPLHRHRVLQSC